MPKKKKFPRVKPLPLAALFTRSNSDEGYATDNELEEDRYWTAERDRQKTASKEAVALGQKRAQTAVLLGEENDYRTNLTATEKTSRAQLENNLSETRIEREWIEFTTARREELKQQGEAKKAPFIQLSTQQMLHRADIADKETEKRISFLNSFAASMNQAKGAEKARMAKEKLEADRKKAAERAKAFEERTRQVGAKKSSLFQLVEAPTASTTESKAPDTTQTGSWLSGWFSKK